MSSPAVFAAIDREVAAGVPLDAAIEQAAFPDWAESSAAGVVRRREAAP